MTLNHEEIQRFAGDAKSMTDHIARVSPDAIFVLVLVNKKEDGEDSISIGANLDQQGICMLLAEALRQVAGKEPTFMTGMRTN